MFDMVHAFCSVIGNEAEPEHYEIQLQLRDYAMIGENKMVGVGIVPLRDLKETGGLHAWVQLGKRLAIDQTGLILLRILSQRPNDEIAKEFCKLKTETRPDDAK